ncbi:MAG: hypothetical protein ACRDY6_10860 [Acidimicrobiia bacterium]
MAENDIRTQTVKEQLQQQLVEELATESGHEGVVIGWIAPLNAHSELIRTLEAEVFPEIPDIMRPYELACEFLALVDTRPSTARVVHAFRLSSATGLSAMREEDPPGTVLLEDLISSGQGLDLGAVDEYYRARGIDLRHSASIETNFRVGPRVDTDTGLSPAQIGYIALFQWILREDLQVLFAHLNEPAVRSLDNVGVGWEPIAGRYDLRTPTVGGSFDDEYSPVAIPVTPENSAVLSSLLEFLPPQVQLG